MLGAMKTITIIFAFVLAAVAVQAQQAQPPLMATYQLGPDFGVNTYTTPVRENTGPVRENTGTPAQIYWDKAALAPLFSLGKTGRRLPFQPAVKIGVSFAF